MCQSHHLFPSTPHPHRRGIDSRRHFCLFDYPTVNTNNEFIRNIYLGATSSNLNKGVFSTTRFSAIQTRQFYLCFDGCLLLDHFSMTPLTVDILVVQKTLMDNDQLDLLLLGRPKCPACISVMIGAHVH